MKFSDRKKHRPPAVIIISLIDILIVLLIFLMVTTTFRETPALSLTLPTSNTASSAGETEQRFVVTIAEEAPHLYLGDQPVAVENLATELSDLASTHANLELSIRPDEDALVGLLVDVIDAAKTANIMNFKLRTKPESNE
ncbi:MAG: hypothetical protein M2R45_02432 [Verrucomicrobia subdivision 3 bacterium]|nr:hypothetical protein [Limisphaerales bacterium]MCS1416363.1 hypothetical protein [Limisphaerales bacterium]